MKKTFVFLLAGALLVAGLTPSRGEAAPTKSACLACRVTKGEAEEEAVKAVRRYEGKEYGFCSEKCAQAFDADPVAYLPPDFPRPTPSFALKDLAGKPISNRSLAGRVVLLDFWATWCAPCRKAMPELQALHEKYASRGLTIVGVSIDEGGPAKVKKFVAAKKFTYAIAVDLMRIRRGRVPREGGSGGSSSTARGGSSLNGRESQRMARNSSANWRSS